MANHKFLTDKINLLITNTIENLQVEWNTNKIHWTVRYSQDVLVQVSFTAKGGKLFYKTYVKP